MTAYVACVWVCLVVVVLQQQVAGFTLTNAVTRRRCSTLFMGRAAAVRAATKAKTDGAKAKNNARFAKKIIMAVKAGGADPDKNRALGQVIADAKVANVPKDVVTRNIEKASAAATADFKSSVFEFYGHGGCGLIVNVLTDNDNRAAADVNLVAKKQLLKNAAMNSVLFKFDTKARLNLQKAIEEDQLMEVCLEVRACVRAVPFLCDGLHGAHFPLAPPHRPTPRPPGGRGRLRAADRGGREPLGSPGGGPGVHLRGREGHGGLARRPARGGLRPRDVAGVRPQGTRLDALFPPRPHVAAPTQRTLFFFAPPCPCTVLFSCRQEGVVDLGDEDFDKNMEAIDAFLALDDVDSVEHNINMTGDD